MGILGRDIRALALGILAAAAAALAGVEVRAGEASPSLEYRVKAAFLFNFAKFVEWPPGAFSSPTSPILISVLGTDPFGDILAETVRDKTINGRRIVVERSDDVERVKTCHIVFISQSEEERLGSILSHLEHSYALTVSEMERFVHMGGGINLITEKEKVRFEINVAPAERAGLRISSKLLNLATVVLPAQPRPGT